MFAVTNGQVFAFGHSVSPWIYGPVIAAALLGLFFLVKLIVLGRLKRWALKRPESVMGVVVRVLDAPLNIAIVAGVLLVLSRLLPLPPELDQPLGVLVKAVLIVSALVLVDRLAVQLLLFFKPRVTNFDISRGVFKFMARGLVFTLGLLVLLEAIGVSVTPLVASLGVGSLAVALALQKPLANFFSGLVILADRTVRTGDFVKLETGEEGYVVNVGWRHTRVRLLGNNTVVVPNERLISSIVQNTYVPEQEMSVLVQVGVHYESRLDHVEQIVIEVGKEIQRRVEGAVADFEPFIRFHTFDSSSINFSVILRAKEFVAGYVLKHEFIKALHRRFEREGIIIPYPLRTLDIPEETARRLRDALVPVRGEGA
ncbi:mechanosensitive ion channel family protein [candidate division WOR-3 bacterium]|nr:mechanosensitive ion channel family protein [candidate division WOR-3 bacterium]